MIKLNIKKTQILISVIVGAWLFAYLFLGITPNSIGAEKRVREYCDKIESTIGVTRDLLIDEAHLHRLRLTDPTQDSYEQMRTERCRDRGLDPLPFILAWEGRTGPAALIGQHSCCYVGYKDNRVQSTEFFKTDGEYCSSYLPLEDILEKSCSLSSNID